MTAVSTLLRFWPPGPDRRVVRKSHSAARLVEVEHGGMGLAGAGIGSMESSVGWTW